MQFNRVFVALMGK